jgi:hypothetical protein
MSQLYYNYLLTCYTKEPPTVTEMQLANALNTGKLTQAEYDSILATKTPETTEPTTAAEEPTI